MTVPPRFIVPEPAKEILTSPPVRVYVSAVKRASPPSEPPDTVTSLAVTLEFRFNVPLEILIPSTSLNLVISLDISTRPPPMTFNSGVWIVPPLKVKTPLELVNVNAPGWTIPLTVTVFVPPPVKDTKSVLEKLLGV